MIQYISEFLPHLGRWNALVCGESDQNLIKVDNNSLISQAGSEIVEIVFPKAFQNYQIKLKSFACIEKELIVKGSYVPSKIKESFEDPEDKWCKKELLNLKHFKFDCLKCGIWIIEKNVNCKVLNSMPSEYWAEMFDFWHCHKPAADGTPNLDDSKYDKLCPSTHEILIGSSSFQGTMETFINRIILEDEMVKCVQCKTVLGKMSSAKLIEIYKWALKLNSEQIYSPEQHVISAIISSVTSDSSRHIIVKSNSSSEQILVWVLAMNIDAILTGEKIQKNALKICYKYLDELPNSNGRFSLHEIDIPHKPFEHFISLLQKNNRLLPDKYRKIGNWNVSYVSAQQL